MFNQADVGDSGYLVRLQTQALDELRLEIAPKDL